MNKEQLWPKSGLLLKVELLELGASSPGPRNSHGHTASKGIWNMHKASSLNDSDLAWNMLQPCLTEAVVVVLDSAR